MNKKEIIILAAIGAGVYILSQVKAMKTYIAPQYAKTAAEKVAEEENEYIRKRTPLTPAVPMPRRIAEKIPDAATPAARRRMAEKIAIRKRTAKKIAEKIGKTVAEKITQKTNVPTLRLEPKRTQLGQLIFLKKTAIAAARAVEQAPKSLPIAQVIFLKKAAANAAQAAAQALAAFQIKIHGMAFPISHKQAIRDRITRAAARKKAQKEAAARSKPPHRIARPISPMQAIRDRITRAVARKKAQKEAAWKAPYKFPKSNFRVITPSDKLQNLAKKDIARKKAVQQKKVQKTTPSTPSARRKKRLEALYGSHWHDIWVQRQRR